MGTSGSKFWACENRLVWQTTVGTLSCLALLYDAQGEWREKSTLKLVFCHCKYL